MHELPTILEGRLNSYENDIEENKMKQKKHGSFPKKLYVYKEEEQGETYYYTEIEKENCMDSDDTEQRLIGVYELVGMSILKVKIEETPVDIE